jgi:hypothetical protein
VKYGEIMKIRKIQSILMICILIFCVFSIVINAKPTDNLKIQGKHMLVECMSNNIVTDFNQFYSNLNRR